MKKLFFLFVIIFSGIAFGQENPKHGIPSPKAPAIEDSVNIGDLKIFEKVDKKPIFSSAHFNSFEENLTENFDTSIFNEENINKIDYCEISLVCEIDGSISSAIEISTTNKDILSETLRTIKYFKKRIIFKPASINDKPVRYRMKFRIEYNYKEKQLKVESINSTSQSSF